MAQRPQVRKFQGPTQANLRPVAAPVDTYVKPVSQPQGPSALSQFVSAITPAIESQAQERKVARLKREKEVADGVQKNKEFQLKLKAKKLIGELGMDYAKNETAYKELDQDVVRNHWRTQKQDYLTELEKVDTDPLLMQTFDNDLELALESFMSETFIPAKYEHTQSVLLSDFADSMRDTNLRLEQGLITKEDAIESIKEDVAGFHSANPDYFNFKDNKVNDALVKLATADDNVFSAVTLYLQSSASKNQLNKSAYAVESGNIEAKQTTVMKKRLKAQAKQTALSSAMTNAFENRNPSALKDLTYTDPSTGDIIQLSNDEVEQAFLIGIQGKGVGEQFALMSQLDFVPKNVQNVVTDISPMLTGSKTPTSVEDLQQLKIGLDTYEALRNAGVDLSFIDDEDTKARLQAFSVLSKDMARAGTRTIVSDTYDEFGDFKETEVQDLNSLAMQIQGIDTTRTMDAKFKESVGDSITTSYFTKDLSDVFNKGEILQKALSVANILNQVGGYESPEAVAEAAWNIVTADNPIVKSGDGTSYAFAELNTNIDKSMDVVSTINEYNTLLQNSTELQQWMYTNKGGLLPDEFAVGLYPDPNNPKAVILKAWDKRQSPPTPMVLGGKLSKQSLLSDRSQLNGLIGQVVTQEDFSPTTTLTPDLGSMNSGARDIEYQLGKVSPAEYLGGTAGPDVPFSESGIMQDAQKALTDLGFSMDNPILQYMLKNTPADAIMEVGGLLKADFLTAIQDLAGTGEVAKPTTNSTLDSVVDTVSSIASTLNPVTSAAAATIIEDEGFSYTQYDDMGKNSVGHGLQVESLEADERALIEDINNVQPEESEAVVALKVQKTSDYFTDVVEGFQNLPEAAQSGMIQMGYQLGRFNVTKNWPKFMASIKEAAKYAEGSIEQASALAEAKFNMLYNEAKDGTITATKWATQTKDRAMKVASEVGDSMMESVMPSAQASTLTETTVDIPVPKSRPKRPKPVEIKHGDSVKNIVPAHMRMFVQDILGLDLDTARTNDFFSEGEINALKDITKRAMTRMGGTTGDIDYDLDYASGQSNVSFAGSSLSMADEEGAIQKTLGDFTWRINDKGEVIITDQYNFNDAAKLKKRYNTELKKMGHITALGAKAAASMVGFNTGVGLYGVLRRIGALYGSEEGQGAKFEINLGKLT